MAGAEKAVAENAVAEKAVVEKTVAENVCNQMSLVSVQATTQLE